MVEGQFGTHPADHTNVREEATIWPVAAGMTEIRVITLAYLVAVTRSIKIKLPLNLSQVVIK